MKDRHEMAKQKKTDRQPLTIPVPAGSGTFTVNDTTVDAATIGRWGYGFERSGGKWRAYRTGPELTYLTPERGEELHAAVARIQQALSKEIGLALKNRGLS